MYFNDLNSLFIHILKCSGNFVVNSLSLYSSDFRLFTTDPTKVNRFELSGKYTVSKHQTLERYKSLMPSSVYSTFKKFSIVIEPVDRLISLYYSQHRWCSLSLLDKALVKISNIPSYITFVFCISPNLLTPTFDIVKFEQMLSQESSQSHYLSECLYEIDIPSNLALFRFGSGFDLISQFLGIVSSSFEPVLKVNSSRSPRTEHFPIGEITQLVKNSHHSVDFDLYNTIS